MQRYRDYKIRVCDKDSISFQTKQKNIPENTIWKWLGWFWGKRNRIYPQISIPLEQCEDQTRITRYRSWKLDINHYAWKLDINSLFCHLEMNILWNWKKWKCQRMVFCLWGGSIIRKRHISAQKSVKIVWNTPMNIWTHSPVWWRMWLIWVLILVLRFAGGGRNLNFLQ